MEIEDYLTLFLVLFVLDLLLVLLRSSLANARLPQLLNMKGQDSNQIERTLVLTEKLRLRVTLRLLVVVMHFLMAGTLWFALVGWIDSLQPAAAWLQFWRFLSLVVAALLILVVEFAVEGAILRSAEAWAVRLTPFATVIDWLFSPISRLLVAMLGDAADLDRRASPVTEDELKNWVEVGQEEGSLEKDERQMIYSIFHFGDTLAREIMVPRIDILALDVSTSLSDAIQALNLSGHSRVPVYEDGIDNIIGLLYAKDLLRVRIDGEEDQSIRQFLRPAYFVPEAKKVDELLREMQTRSVHMAVVVDEYGGMAGLVTMEDIVEEIVGEIRDEYDQSEELLYQQVGPEEFLFHGRIDLEDVNEVLGTHFTKDLADTLGGFLYGTIGRVPAGGEEVIVEDWTLQIDQVSGRRIRKVRAIRREAETIEPPREKTNDKR